MTTLAHLCRRTVLAALIAGFALAPVGLAAAGLDLRDTVAEDSLPKSKHTKPGFYITAAEASRVLEEHDNVALVEVRTPSEIMLIGYATPTAAAIPAQFVDPDIGAASKNGTYKMVSNPGFEAEMQAWLASDAAKGIDTLIVTCRSGSRSAAAINRMVAAGIELPLYNMVDGFEGDKNDEGVRAVNGWRNAGLPWTYKIRDGLRPAVK